MLETVRFPTRQRRQCSRGPRSQLNAIEKITESAERLRNHLESSDSQWPNDANRALSMPNSHRSIGFLSNASG